MVLRLQSPGAPDTNYLIDFLLDACDQAEAGGGAFAYATPAGVKLLLNNESFDRFKSHRPFDLIVGTDAITTTRSLLSLHEAAARLGGLSVQAFFNSNTKNAFHPKFCWFRTHSGGILITGSGNLTRGGLFRNWEAFSVESLSVTATQAVERQWNDWKAYCASMLRPIDDADVTARAEENARQPVRKLKEAEAPEQPEKEQEVEAPSDLSDVVITEIPRGGDRWDQTNISQQFFEKYFHAAPGGHTRLFLHHFKSDGTISPEAAIAFRVKSHNYRFKIGAAARLAYPSHGRPIAVFVRVGTRIFRYSFLMPGDADYRRIAEFLEQNATTPPRQMRRLQIPASTLKAAWPNSPLWT